MVSSVLDNFTHHATIRMQQRGKSTEDVKMVLRYGTDRQGRVLLYSKDARREIERRKRWLARLERRSGDRRLMRAMRRRIKSLDKTQGCVVVSQNGSVITLFNAAKRIHDRRRSKSRFALFSRRRRRLRV